MRFNYLQQHQFSGPTSVLEGTRKTLFIAQKAAFIRALFWGSVRFVSFPFKIAEFLITSTLSFVFSGILLNALLIVFHPVTFFHVFADDRSFAKTLNDFRAQNFFLNKIHNPTMNIIQKVFEALPLIPGSVVGAVAFLIGLAGYRIIVNRWQRFVDYVLEGFMEGHPEEIRVMLDIEATEIVQAYLDSLSSEERHLLFNDDMFQFRLERALNNALGAIDQEKKVADGKEHIENEDHDKGEQQIQKQNVARMLLSYPELALRVRQFLKDYVTNKPTSLLAIKLVLEFFPSFETLPEVSSKLKTGDASSNPVNKPVLIDAAKNVDAPGKKEFTRIRKNVRTTQHGLTQLSYLGSKYNNQLDALRYPYNLEYPVQGEADTQTLITLLGQSSGLKDNQITTAENIDRNYKTAALWPSLLFGNVVAASFRSVMSYMFDLKLNSKQTPSPIDVAAIVLAAEGDGTGLEHLDGQYSVASLAKEVAANNGHHDIGSDLSTKKSIVNNDMQDDIVVQQEQHDELKKFNTNASYNDKKMSTSPLMGGNKEIEITINRSSAAKLCSVPQFLRKRKKDLDSKPLLRTKSENDNSSDPSSELKIVKPKRSLLRDCLPSKKSKLN